MQRVFRPGVRGSTPLYRLDSYVLYFRSSLARTKSIQKQEDAFEVYTSASWKDGPGFFSISLSFNLLQMTLWLKVI